MPDSPNFAITYPCMDTAITLADFATLADDTEAAITTVNSEATAATQDPAGHAFFFTAAAVGVETIMTYSAVPAVTVASGITLNAAAGTWTIVTPGIYIASGNVQANQSTLTMTSQRIGTFLNGTLYAVRKYRGTNPVTVGAITGSYSAVIGPLVAGDVVTFRYLWTGTGALTANASGYVAINFLANT
jgi:hypothetical protein